MARQIFVWKCRHSGYVVNTKITHSEYQTLVDLGLRRSATWAPLPSVNTRYSIEMVFQSGVDAKKAVLILMLGGDSEVVDHTDGALSSIQIAEE